MEVATISMDGENVLFRLPAILAKSAAKTGLDVRYELSSSDCQISVWSVTGDKMRLQKLAFRASVRAEQKLAFRVTMRAITALTTLCKERSMRQAARICAWLIGADISRAFENAYVIDMTDVGALAVDMDQAFLLARIMQNGQMRTKQIERIDPRVETMLWCGIKAVETQTMSKEATHAIDRLLAKAERAYETYAPKDAAFLNSMLAHATLGVAMDEVFNIKRLSLNNKLTKSLCDYEMAAAIIRTIV